MQNNKFFSRLNIASSMFVMMLLALMQFLMMNRTGTGASASDFYRVFGFLALFGFVFIRTALLYVRKGEAKD